VSLINGEDLYRLEIYRKRAEGQSLGKKRHCAILFLSRIFALWLAVTTSGTFRSISTVVVGKYFSSARDIDASHGKMRSDALYREAARSGDANRLFPSARSQL